MADEAVKKARKKGQFRVMVEGDGVSGAKGYFPLKTDRPLENAGDAEKWLRQNPQVAGGALCIIIDLKGTVKMTSKQVTKTVVEQAEAAW